MNQTEPRERELYEPPLVLDIEPFTMPCVQGESLPNPDYDPNDY